MRFSFDDVTHFATSLLAAAGVREADAAVTARRLAEADFRGRTGHGLIRLVPYLDRIAAGGINLRPRMRLLAETPVAVQIDADNGLGQVAVTWAAELAVAKARTSGIAVVGTTRSNHAGAAGLYPAMLAEQNVIGIYTAVANANGMPPWGGIDPLLGTNPIAVAIPSATGTPFLLDIATTTASHGTIKVARQGGTEMPVGWVVDVAGEPITDPARSEEGFLVPIGGYKGSGLNIALGLLAGVLNGAAFGREVIDHRVDRVSPTNTGQLLIAIRADVFRPLESVLTDITAHLEALRGSRSADGSAVRLPGDRAGELFRQNLAHGIEVPAPLLASLDVAADRLLTARLSRPATGAPPSHDPEGDGR